MTFNLNNNINTRVHKFAPSFRGGERNPYVVSDLLEKCIVEAGKMSSPQNRFFLGVTALAIQPVIDLNNKDVDEKTRKVSACRTAAKIIAGTVVGVPVRALCIKYSESWSLSAQELSKEGQTRTIRNSLLVPKGVENYGKIQRLVKNYRNAVGSIIALGVMLITNFALDLPITKFLTNFFADKFVEKEPVTHKIKGGN